MSLSALQVGYVRKSLDEFSQSFAAGNADESRMKFDSLGVILHHIGIAENVRRTCPNAPPAGWSALKSCREYARTSLRWAVDLAEGEALWRDIRRDLAIAEQLGKPIEEAIDGTAKQRAAELTTRPSMELGGLWPNLCHVESTRKQFLAELVTIVEELIGDEPTETLRSLLNRFEGYRNSKEFNHRQMSADGTAAYVSMLHDAINPPPQFWRFRGKADVELLCDRYGDGEGFTEKNLRTLRLRLIDVCKLTAEQANEVPAHEFAAKLATSGEESNLPHRAHSSADAELRRKPACSWDPHNHGIHRLIQLIDVLAISLNRFRQRSFRNPDDATRSEMREEEGAIRAAVFPREDIAPQHTAARLARGAFAMLANPGQNDSVAINNTQDWLSGAGWNLVPCFAPDRPESELWTRFDAEGRILQNYGDVRDGLLNMLARLREVIPAEVEQRRRLASDSWQGKEIPVSQKQLLEWIRETEAAETDDRQSPPIAEEAIQFDFPLKPTDSASVAKVPLPEMAGINELAKFFGVTSASIESYLRRYRAKYPDCCHVVEEGGRRRNESKYLYRTKDVGPALEKHLDGKSRK
jgi:hypothetical protein